LHPAVLGRSSYRILVPGFLIGALCLALFGRLTSSIGLMATISALAGFFIGGSSAGMIALAATTYRTFMRSTGIGWAMGMGRFGQIFGPLGFGLLVGWHWGVDWIFYSAAVPCLICAIFVVLLRLEASRHRVPAGETTCAPSSRTERMSKQ